MTKVWALVAIGLGISQIGVSVYADPAGFNAPRWLVALIGAAFSLVGVILLVPRRFRTWHAFLIALFVTAFAVAPSWIAFGPGSRRFTSSISGIVLPDFGPSGELPGRFVFGISGVFMTIMAVWCWVQWMRLLFGRRSQSPAPVTSSSGVHEPRAPPPANKM